MFITLKAKTLKGKNIIHNHGDRWMIIRERNNVIALHNNPGKLIRSMETGDQRWIFREDDPHFDIIEDDHIHSH